MQQNSAACRTKLENHGASRIRWITPPCHSVTAFAKVLWKGWVTGEPRDNDLWLCTAGRPGAKAGLAAASSRAPWRVEWSCSGLQGLHSGAGCHLSFAFCSLRCAEQGQGGTCRTWISLSAAGVNKIMLGGYCHSSGWGWSRVQASSLPVFTHIWSFCPFVAERPSSGNLTSFRMAKNIHPSWKLEHCHIYIYYIYIYYFEIIWKKFSGFKIHSYHHNTFEYDINTQRKRKSC